MTQSASQPQWLDTTEYLFVSVVHTFDTVGHFVQEEKGEALVPMIETFMQKGGEQNG